MHFIPLIQKTIVIVVGTRPLPKDEGMAEYHGAPETAQLTTA